MRVIISLSGTTPILKCRGCFLSHFGVYFFGGGGGEWILVSLRVFGWKILYLPIQVSLSTVHKETYKKMPLTTQKSP